MVRTELLFGDIIHDLVKEEVVVNLLVTPDAPKVLVDFSSKRRMKNSSKVYEENYQSGSP